MLIVELSADHLLFVCLSPRQNSRPSRQKVIIQLSQHVSFLVDIEKIFARMPQVNSVRLGKGRFLMDCG